MSHYFSLTKSRSLLGYEPLVEPDRQWTELLRSYGIQAASKANKNNFYTRISRDESAEAEHSLVNKIILALPLVIALACKLIGMEIF